MRPVGRDLLREVRMVGRGHRLALRPGPAGVLRLVPGREVELAAVDEPLGALLADHRRDRGHGVPDHDDATEVEDGSGHVGVGAQAGCWSDRASCQTPGRDFVISPSLISATRARRAA